MKLTWKDVLQDAWNYYNTDPDVFNPQEVGNGAGGNLHIVLDDGNIGDDNIRFCLNWIKQKEKDGFFDPKGKALAEKLLSMHWIQRARLYHHYHLYAYGNQKWERLD